MPEENSLLLDVGGERFELPSIDVVFRHPRDLLGELTYARFGAEFPIRFDFLDTMQGGNLSLQVHPLRDYIYDRLGMPYTQDESYYLLDAAEHAAVYLGLRTGMVLAGRRTEPGGEQPIEVAEVSQTAVRGDRRDRTVAHAQLGGQAPQMTRSSASL